MNEDQVQERRLEELLNFNTQSRDYLDYLGINEGEIRRTYEQYGHEECYNIVQREFCEEFIIHNESSFQKINEFIDGWIGENY